MCRLFFLLLQPNAAGVQVRNDASRIQSQQGLLLAFLRGKDPGDIQGIGIRELLTIGKLVSIRAIHRARRNNRETQSEKK